MTDSKTCVLCAEINVELRTLNFILVLNHEFTYHFCDHARLIQLQRLNLWFCPTPEKNFEWRRQASTQPRSTCRVFPRFPATGVMSHLQCGYRCGKTETTNTIRWAAVADPACCEGWDTKLQAMGPSLLRTQNTRTQKIDFCFHQNGRNAFFAWVMKIYRA